MDADCRDCNYLAVEFEVIGTGRSFVCAYPGDRRTRRRLGAFNPTSKLLPPSWCPLKKTETSDD